MRTPFPQSTHLPRARLIGSLVEYDKEFLPSLKSQSPSLHRRRTSACLHFHRACAPHPRTEHREYHSASTRRPRSCWQWRYKLGRRPRVTKVRTSHSHPSRPPFVCVPATPSIPSTPSPLAHSAPLIVNLTLVLMRACAIPQHHAPIFARDPHLLSRVSSSPHTHARTLDLLLILVYSSLVLRHL